jgi:hypothetical protein
LTPTADVRLLRRRDVTVQPIDGGALLVDMRSGACFELNRTGAEIWELLANGATIRSICETLAARYDVPNETIAADVRDIVDALKKQKLVEPSSSSGAGP